MRPSQKSNRSRGKSHRKNTGNNINRVYESAGPEGKVRGTPQQIIDKYNALARDAQTSGDRVAAENFLQHSEHYLRLLSAAVAATAERREQANGSQQHAQQPAPQVAQQPVQQSSGKSELAAQPQPQAQAKDGRGDVNGMATIDGAENTQLVDTPETERRKGGARGRRPRGGRNAPAEAVREEAKPAVNETVEAEQPVEETAQKGA